MTWPPTRAVTATGARRFTSTTSYFIHTLGWRITGDPNATLYFTHPGGWLTLESPLPGR